MNSLLKDLTIGELKQERKKYELLLDEYRDERQMILGQTGHHISSTGMVKKYAALIGETEEVIAEIDALIESAPR